MEWKTITHGNHSYLYVFPAYPPGEDSPHQRAGEILFALQNFGEKHPDIEIIGWKLETTQFPNNETALRGIWVDHRPKPKQ